MLKLVFLVTAIFFSCGQSSYKNLHILIVTGLGDIEVELYSDKAPKTAAAFLSKIN